MTRRTSRVADLLRGNLSELLLRRANDPRLSLVGITNVNVSPDLHRAVVGVSVLGDEQRCNEALNALRKASGFFRSELARRERHLRVIPQLVFELDRGAEYSQKISDLLESLHDNNEST